MSAWEHGDEMPAGRLQTQSRVCSQMVVETLQRALLDGKPADRCLKDAFYLNRQLGARDRRLISETLFALLRWWGWLSRLAPPAFSQAWEQDTPLTRPTEPGEWLPCLAAAWLLEPRLELPPAARAWMTELGWNETRRHPLDPDATLSQRAARLAEVCPEIFPQPPAVDALIPAWTGAMLGPEGAVHLDRLTSWMQRRPPVWLRAQIADLNWLQRQLQNDGLPTSRHPALPSALRLDAAVQTNLRGLETFRHGDFEIQDLASQAVALICAPKPGEQWWDACAGGGGKTLHLAWLMQGKGSVVASDIRAHKLAELKLRARRAEFPNIRYKEWKGKAMPTFRRRFAGVLVDTPCSCSGTWRRNPDARWTTAPHELAEFAILQQQLLSHAADAVAPGGTLVYSTCSMFPAENQDIVQAFLAASPDFQLVPFHCPVTGRDCDGMNQVWAWEGDCDTMFTAKMRRQ